MPSTTLQSVPHTRHAYGLHLRLHLHRYTAQSTHRHASGPVHDASGCRILSAHLLRTRGVRVSCSCAVQHLCAPLSVRAARDVTGRLAVLPVLFISCCVLVGVWTIQRNPDGTRFYWNKVANKSKASLDEKEQKLLVPELSPYDNDIVMPLEVRSLREIAGWATRGKGRRRTQAGAGFHAITGAGRWDECAWGVHSSMLHAFLFQYVKPRMPCLLSWLLPLLLRLLVCAEFLGPPSRCRVAA